MNSSNTAEEAFQKLRSAFYIMFKEVAKRLGFYKMLNWLTRLLRRSQKGEKGESND